MQAEVDQCIHFIIYILRQSGEGAAAAGSRPNRLQRLLEHDQPPLRKFTAGAAKSKWVSVCDLSEIQFRVRCYLSCLRAKTG